MPKSPLLFVIFDPYATDTELVYPVVAVPCVDHVPLNGSNTCLKLPMTLMLVPTLVARQNPIASVFAYSIYTTKHQE